MHAYYYRLDFTLVICVCIYVCVRIFYFAIGPIHFLEN